MKSFSVMASYPKSYIEQRSLSFGDLGAKYRATGKRLWNRNFGPPKTFRVNAAVKETRMRNESKNNNNNNN